MHRPEIATINQIAVDALRWNVYSPEPYVKKGKSVRLEFFLEISFVPCH